MVNVLGFRMVRGEKGRATSHPETPRPERQEYVRGCDLPWGAPEGEVEEVIAEEISPQVELSSIRSNCQALVS